ncbi:MAG: sugar ABC transporter permease, partial [Bacillota bacterium]
RPPVGESAYARVLLAPTAVVLGGFNLFPAVYSLYLSFVSWDGIAAVRPWVGLRNYAALLTSSEFWNSVAVTLAYAGVVTVASTVLGLAVAVLLNQNVAGRGIYRVLYFLPVITPSVAVGVVWKYLFDPYQGVFNKMLAPFGVAGPSWLTDPVWARPAVIIVGIWKRTGFNMVIYLAALQDIPHSLREAAAIDGATAWQRFRRITVPLLAPATFVITVTGVIEGFQVFDLVYVMTAGGPLGATDVLGYYLYRYGFRYSQMGYASAVAFTAFILIFATTLVQYRFAPGGRRYEAT